MFRKSLIYVGVPPSETRTWSRVPKRRLFQRKQTLNVILLLGLFTALTQAAVPPVGPAGPVWPTTRNDPRPVTICTKRPDPFPHPPPGRNRAAVAREKLRKRSLKRLPSQISRLDRRLVAVEVPVVPDTPVAGKAFFGLGGANAFENLKRPTKSTAGTKIAVENLRRSFSILRYLSELDPHRGSAEDARFLVEQAGLALQGQPVRLVLKDVDEVKVNTQTARDFGRLVQEGIALQEEAEELKSQLRFTRRSKRLIEEYIKDSRTEKERGIYRQRLRKFEESEMETFQNLQDKVSALETNHAKKRGLIDQSVGFSLP